MAESGLDSLRETHAIQVEWRAYELRPAGLPPPDPEEVESFRRYVLKAWPRVQAIARERFGLELRREEDIHHRPTRLAHIGAKFAAEHGQGPAYHRAVFKAHWQDLQDISDAETLAGLARGLGLDEAGFRAALDDPRYAEQVERDEYWAYQEGLGGVPAFIFGNRYLVSGAQPVEVLRQAADRCLQEGRVL